MEFHGCLSVIERNVPTGLEVPLLLDNYLTLKRRQIRE